MHFNRTKIKTVSFFICKILSNIMMNNRNYSNLKTFLCVFLADDEVLCFFFISVNDECRINSTVTIHRIQFDSSTRKTQKCEYLQVTPRHNVIQWVRFIIHNFDLISTSLWTSKSRDTPFCYFIPFSLLLLLSFNSKIITNCFFFSSTFASDSSLKRSADLQQWKI